MQIKMDEIAQKLARLNELVTVENVDNNIAYAEWLRTRDEINELLKPYGLEVLYNTVWSRYCIG